MFSKHPLLVWEAAIVKCNFQTAKLGPIFFESYSYSDYIKLDPQKKNCGKHPVLAHFRFWARNAIFRQILPSFHLWYGLKS